MNMPHSLNDNYDVGENVPNGPVYGAQGRNGLSVFFFGRTLHCTKRRKLTKFY